MGAPVQSPDRTAMAAAKLQRWEDGWAPRYLTDPTQHCHSQNHHTGPDSVGIHQEELCHKLPSLNTPFATYCAYKSTNGTLKVFHTKLSRVDRMCALICITIRILCRKSLDHVTIAYTHRLTLISDTRE